MDGLGTRSGARSVSVSNNVSGGSVQLDLKGESSMLMRNTCIAQSGGQRIQVLNILCQLEFSAARVLALKLTRDNDVSKISKEEGLPPGSSVNYARCTEFG